MFVATESKTVSVLGKETTFYWKDRYHSVEAALDLDTAPFLSTIMHVELHRYPYLPSLYVSSNPIKVGEKNL